MTVAPARLALALVAAAALPPVAGCAPPSEASGGGGPAVATGGRGGAVGAGGAIPPSATGGAGTGGHAQPLDAGHGPATADAASEAPVPVDVSSVVDVPAATPGDAAPEAGAGDAEVAGAVIWRIDNLLSIGGHRTSVVGNPMIIDTPAGKAVQFDGVDDAIFVENHPLAGLGEFTVEVIFRPDPGGMPAQRFFHMQDSASGGRVLYETRLPGMNRWVLDVFVESAGGEVPLYTASAVHPLGAWYNGAAVIDGKRARHYVNGVEESSFALTFRPHGPGRTSIGVRINRMYHFKGAIRLARFTPRVLTPAEFLRVE